MIKIQQRIGRLKPFLGSGKIKRRIDIKKPRRRKIFDTIKLQRRVELKREIRLKKIDFKDDKTKMIFLHWNTKGMPFTTHKLIEGIIVSSGINKAYKISKKYSFRTVREAIDLCHDTFTSPWFKFRTDKVGIAHLTLSDFFRYNRGKQKEIRENYKQLAGEEIKSWFKECLQGEIYLKEKYSYYLKDKNKELTRKLKKVWLTYSPDTLLPVDKNSLIVCSQKAAEFARLNEHLGVSAEGVIMTIDNMLNKFHIFEPKHIGWITTANFWNKQLPKELVRYGTITNINRSKMCYLPWDKK